MNAEDQNKGGQRDESTGIGETDMQKMSNHQEKRRCKGYL
jgi:hypothetical protein